MGGDIGVTTSARNRLLHKQGWNRDIQQQLSPSRLDAIILARDTIESLNWRKVSWSGRLLLSSKSALALRSTGICPPNSDIAPQRSGILDRLQGNPPGRRKSGAA